MPLIPHCCALSEYVLHWCHPPCFDRTWRIAAVLRGVQAAGVALCYGNNNGGACAAGSVHPLAPSMAQSSPWLFSCPARLSNKPPPSPLLLFTPATPVSPLLRLHSLPTFLSFSSSPLSLPLSVPICMPPVFFLLQSLLSISSFLLPHKDIHSPMALRGRRTKHALKMQSLRRNATAVGISALRFAPALLARLTLYFLFTEGSLFSIAPVWERVRWRSGVEGRGAAGPAPGWKE